ncbi:hypothetical protein Thiowin_03057 [Thiorhodovibrio winogradskyi]|uniref:Uncharacterized protein n=1 Tax=Thiorhodovibrio winogradskyi TaxID=77007 RepID=A0ABZ0SBU6_9GAMM
MAPPRIWPQELYLPQLDVRLLHREGLLFSGSSLRLSWLHLQRECEIFVRGDQLLVTWGRGYSESVEIIWRQGTLGGRYPSLRCPNFQRSAALIYGHDRFFGCRVFKPVAYRCQSESRYDRTLRRAGKLRERLGWQRGVIQPVGQRPFYMNRTTFERITTQIDELTHQALGVTNKRLEWTIHGLEGRREDAHAVGSTAS